MLLTIDCGNTNTVLSIWDGKEFICTMRTSTHHARTADAYFTWFTTLLNHYQINPVITEIIISSTVPRVVFNLRVFADRFFGCRPLVVGKSDCKLPQEPRVDAGTIVGPDRLVNAAGAYNRHAGNLIVVDFGTATTFDVVASDGAYIGGLIAPGVNLSLEALHMSAAALPHVDISKPQQVIGKNTVACMQSGVFWGYVGLVKECCTRIQSEKGTKMKIIGTGGLAPLFADTEKLFDVVDNNLTMHGLVTINNFNRTGGSWHGE